MRHICKVCDTEFDSGSSRKLIIPNDSNECCNGDNIICLPLSRVIHPGFDTTWYVEEGCHLVPQNYLNQYSNARKLGIFTSNIEAEKYLSYLKSRGRWY